MDNMDKLIMVPLHKMLPILEKLKFCSKHGVPPEFFGIKDYTVVEESRRFVNSITDTYDYSCVETTLSYIPTGDVLSELEKSLGVLKCGNRVKDFIMDIVYNSNAVVSDSDITSDEMSDNYIEGLKTFLFSDGVSVTEFIRCNGDTVYFIACAGTVYDIDIESDFTISNSLSGEYIVHLLNSVNDGSVKLHLSNRIKKTDYMTVIKRFVHDEFKDEYNLNCCKTLVGFDLGLVKR